MKTDPITPKVLANFSPGLLQPWGPVDAKAHNAEGVGEWRTTNSRTLSELSSRCRTLAQG